MGILNHETLGPHEIRFSSTLVIVLRHVDAVEFCLTLKLALRDHVVVLVAEICDTHGIQAVFL